MINEGRERKRKFLIPASGTGNFDHKWCHSSGLRSSIFLLSILVGIEFVSIGLSSTVLRKAFKLLEIMPRGSSKISEKVSSNTFKFILLVLEVLRLSSQAYEKWKKIMQTTKKKFLVTFQWSWLVILKKFFKCYLFENYSKLLAFGNIKARKIF